MCVIVEQLSMGLGDTSLLLKGKTDEKMNGGSDGGKGRIWRRRWSSPGGVNGRGKAEAGALSAGRKCMEIVAAGVLRILPSFP